ncbi:MAG: hypothetical protein QXW10_02615 [Candidatus Micrarchaeaceae archaeon]
MNFKLIGIFALLSISFALLPYAQLGEQAGEPVMNVSVGSSSFFNYSVLNSGSTPINFTVIISPLNTIPHNATPTVTVTPMNGTLAPHSSAVVSIKVSMPSSDKPGLEWQGIVQVVEASPTSTIHTGEGAVITAGIAKILTIYSAKAKPLPLIYYVVIIVVVVIVIAAAISAVLLKRSSKAHKAVASRAKSIAAVRRTTEARRKTARKTTKKTTAKKTAKRRSAPKAKGTSRKSATSAKKPRRNVRARTKRR